MAFMMAAMVIATLQGHAQTSDTLVVRALESKGIRFSHNNSVTLLMSGQEKFDDLFQGHRPGPQFHSHGILQLS